MLQFHTLKYCISSLAILFSCYGIFAQQQQPFLELKGTVIDANTQKKLQQVSIQVLNSNVSTVSNNEGKFSLKIPNPDSNKSIVVSLLGYQNKSIKIEDLDNQKGLIYLKPSEIYNLEGVEIKGYKNAKELVQKIFEKREKNYSNQRAVVTSFFRETIKKRRKNISLSEAVLDIYKEPYDKSKSDVIKLIKARKKTDYKKLDTIAFKLQGGPYNVLYTDVVKYPEYIFSFPNLNNYNFTFGASTEINGEQVQSVNFKQKSEITAPLYYGTLFISKESSALIRTTYSLNISNKKEASLLFIKKKPNGVFIRPLFINYRVDYRNKNDKWFYSYSNAELSFKVKKRKKLFNSIYSLSIEMATTDWKLSVPNEDWNRRDNIKESIIMSEATLGFSDPKFWGEYNVIEPEKSIESAIRKIQKSLGVFN